MARLLPLSPGLELEQAEKLRRTSIATDFERGVLLEDEVMGVKMPPTEFILENLITEKSINLINGFREMGKSWLSMMIANEVTFEKWMVEAYSPPATSNVIYLSVIVSPPPAHTHTRSVNKQEEHPIACIVLTGLLR